MNSRRLKTILIASIVLIAVASAYSQGYIAFCNRTAPTHIGSIDGPLADHSIRAQFYLGLDPQSMMPVQTPSMEHGFGGTIFGCIQNVVIFDNYSSGTQVYVQMFAWDGNLWGTAFDAVPVDQLGMTDIVLFTFASPTLPPGWPRFTQSAIVPIPEPSLWRWAGVGLGGIWLMSRRRGRLTRNGRIAP